jgi:hypothetical protein
MYSRRGLFDQTSPLREKSRLNDHLNRWYLPVLSRSGGDHRLDDGRFEKAENGRRRSKWPDFVKWPLAGIRNCPALIVTELSVTFRI